MFLKLRPAPIAANKVGIALPLFTIPSKTSINFPPASIAPLRKLEFKVSFASCSNFAWAKSIDAWIDLLYSSFSSRAEPSACVASS